MPGSSAAGSRERPRVQRPFEGNYAASLMIAILALVPYVIVSTAIVPYR